MTTFQMQLTTGDLLTDLIEWLEPAHNAPYGVRKQAEALRNRCNEVLAAIRKDTEAFDAYIDRMAAEREDGRLDAISAHFGHD